MRPDHPYAAPMRQYLSAKFGERLRQARVAAGLGQEELANRLGVKRQAISTWENGKRHPPMTDVEDIAKAVSVRPAWLAYGDGEP